MDYYGEKLSEGGVKEVQQCGGLKDKFGVSWQVVPRVLPEMLLDSDTAKSQRTFEAMLKMKTLDIAECDARMRAHPADESAFLRPAKPQGFRSSSASVNVGRACSRGERFAPHRPAFDSSWCHAPERAACLSGDRIRRRRDLPAHHQRFPPAIAA